jgi:hypothetical protein
MAKRSEGARGSLAGLIRGDLPIARRLGDPRMRRIIRQLQDAGWPIFELAGKRCAFPADLDAMVYEVLAGIGQPGRNTALKPREARKAKKAAATTEENTCA